MSDIVALYEAFASLYGLYATVEGNQKRCEVLKNRCRNIEGNIRAAEKTLNKRNTACLLTLRETVLDCSKFIKTYGTGSWFRSCWNVLSAHTLEIEFSCLCERLTGATVDLNLSISINNNNNNRAMEEANRLDNNALIHKTIELAFSAGIEASRFMNEDQIRDLKERKSMGDKVQFLASIVPCLQTTMEKSGLILYLADDEKSGQESIVGNLSGIAIDFTKLDLERSEENFLGEGSFAKVFSCKYNGEFAAAKEFSKVAGLSNVDVCAIKREAKIMQLVDHPNIVKFLGFNLTKASALLLMEKASCSLHDAIHRREELTNTIPLNTTVKEEWFRQIAAALHYLHCRKIVHRDIKPQNVLLVSVSGQYRVKLTDFGISKVVGTSSSSLTNSNSGVGTTPYMAPELFLIEDGAAASVYSPAVDVYAFGVLMNEVMLQVQPWLGCPQISIMFSVREGSRPKLFVPQNETERNIMKIIGDKTCGCLAAKRELRPSAALLFPSESISIVEEVADSLSDKEAPGDSPWRWMQRMTFTSPSESRKSRASADSEVGSRRYSEGGVNLDAAANMAKDHPQVYLTLTKGNPVKWL